VRSKQPRRWPSRLNTSKPFSESKPRQPARVAARVGDLSPSRLEPLVAFPVASKRRFARSVQVPGCACLHPQHTALRSARGPRHARRGSEDQYPGVGLKCLRKVTVSLQRQKHQQSDRVHPSPLR
jgi:hypothetical protein